MGISLSPGTFLARNARHVAGAASRVVPRRQKIHLPERKMNTIVGMLNKMGVDVSREDLVQEDGFSERLQEARSYLRIDAIDFTDMEGAVCGHEFFQIGPDVPWCHRHHARGYEMLEVSITVRTAPKKVTPRPDQTGHGHGGEIALAGPHMMLYSCCKPLESVDYNTPIQGHHV